jgi:hypothetical protein
MKIEQRKWADGSWSTVSEGSFEEAPQLVLVFGDRETLEKEETYKEINEFYPDSHIVLGSSAGEIMGASVTDGEIALTAIHFEKTNIEVVSTSVTEAAESEKAAKELVKKLPSDGLRHAMVFSEGLKVNGTYLANTLSSELPDDVSVTGGLVGDGANFASTAVGLNGPAKSGTVVLIGYYGDAFKVSYGSIGGWDDFGPARTVTKSTDNILFELDGEPALKLYKEYLGEKADELPGSGLLFPINLEVEGEKEVVRTLLAVDEEAQSMTFAGNMPEGAKARLMKANFDRLIDGAGDAAGLTAEVIEKGKAEIAILVSCIGRKLVLGDRVEEELDAVQEVVGEQVAITGFYSYGEVCPITPTEKQCRLHNQTMTITTMRED